MFQYHPQNILKNNNDEYPENKNELLVKRFYMENYNARVRNEEELHLLIKITTTIKTERKF